MRGNKYALILFLALMVVSVGFVAAANSQGLTWGITVGDEFRFSIVGESNLESYPPYNEVIVITVTSLSTIPDTVSTTSSPGSASYDIEYANGSSVYGSLGTTLAFPVGNWALLTEILNEAFEDMDTSYYDSYNLIVVDLLSIWGVEGSYTIDDIVSEMKQHYSKSDGVLNYYMSNILDTDTGDFRRMTITRDGYLGGILGMDPMLAIIGVVGVVALIVVVIVVVKR